MDAATAPIAMTTPSPKPTPVPVPRTTARCTLWILGRWAGPATREVKWSSACELYYILLLPISTSLLDIITRPVITYYYCLLLQCYYIIFTHYYIIYFHVLLQFCQDTVITSFSHIITSFIIPCYYMFCYYTVITSLLRIITYSLLPIITTSLLRIITSLLHHYYIIITSLLLHYSQLQKLVIMSSLLHIMHYPCFHYYIVIRNLLPITIITHYYMLPTGQLADGVYRVFSWKTNHVLIYFELFYVCTRIS